MADMQWDRCVICQENVFLERLRCPKRSNQNITEQKRVYEAFLENVKKLRNAGHELATTLKLPPPNYCGHTFPQ